MSSPFVKIRGLRSFIERAGACLARVVWRGEPPEVNFYAFWRVRLALHVTAKGYIFQVLAHITSNNQ